MKKLFNFLVLFICLQSNAQTFQWAKGFGGGASYFVFPEQVHGVITDSSGNSYITGYFSNTVDFDPGVNTFNLTSSGLGDIFVSKLDSNGNFIWAKKIGGGGDDWGYSIALDNSNNIIIIGNYHDTVDFDPGPNSMFLYQTDSVNSNYGNIFVLKMDSSGNFIWVKDFRGSDYKWGVQISIDSFDNIYTCGIFSKPTDFDPTSNLFLMSSNGAEDIFVAKLDSNGSLIWAKSVGGIGQDQGRICLDKNGNLYIVGAFVNTVDFDPGPGVTNLTSSGYYNSFILKLDYLGNFVWVKHIAGGNTYGNLIAFSPMGNIYIAGSLAGSSVDFDPSSSLYLLSANTSAHHSFLAKYDTSGNLIWANKFLTFNHPLSTDRLLVNNNDECFYLSYQIKSSDVDPSSKIFKPIAQDTLQGDALLLKFFPNGDLFWGKQIKGDLGNNQRVRLNMTQDYKSNLLLSGHFGGQVDFNPGIGTYNLQSNSNIDMVLFMLSDCEPPYHYDSIHSCNHTITLNGITYNGSGNYIQQLTALNGCDSSISYNIGLINPVGNPIFASNFVLYANVASANAYQWIKCNPFTIINGATNSNYSPTENGEYAVIVEQNGCIDTSNCVTVIGVGVNEIELSGLSVYPNPSTGTFVISSMNMLEKASLKVTNSLGQVVYEKNNVSGAEFEINFANQAVGFYTLEISEGDKVSRLKLLTQ